MPRLVHFIRKSSSHILLLLWIYKEFLYSTDGAMVLKYSCFAWNLVISALSRFGPGSFRPNLVCRFGLIFIQSSNILYTRYLCCSRLVTMQIVLQGHWGLLLGDDLYLYFVLKKR